MIALLAFLLGGLLTAAINLGGRPAGHGGAGPAFLLLPVPGNALYVPWPAYASGAAAVGMLAGGLVAGVILYLRYRKNWKLFNGPAGTDPPLVTR